MDNSKTIFTRIERYIYKRNNVIYVMKRKDGQLSKARSPMQGALAIDARGKPTAELRRWVKVWVEGVINQKYLESIGDNKRVPSWAELMKTYREMAEVEWSVNHSPAPNTVAMIVAMTARVIRLCGCSVVDRIDGLTEERLQRFVEESIAGGLKPVSAFNAVHRVEQLFSAWALKGYRARGFLVDKIVVPKPRGAYGVKSYVRPPESLRLRTIEWVKGLESSAPELWMPAAWMLFCAVRNGDVGRLRWCDIQRNGDRWMLHYIPQKTQASSGNRGVTWPLADDFVESMRAAARRCELPDGEDDLICGGCIDWVSICSGMRVLGWAKEKYSKAAYELRKMCVDRVYQVCGVERAAQVSGDDIKTLSRYYVDPSRASFEVPELF